MCGITGWLYSPRSEPSDSVLAAMSDSIRHRGPDDTGDFRDREAGVALAHRRLSIIDLTDASHQPMLDDERRIALAYNGELYNFRALRAELVGLGHAFRSDGDTEVVLRSYIEWGVAAFDRFAGMFAIAIWDGMTQTLHLARDAMGMKPLYFVEHKTGVAFASEVKVFQALPDHKMSLNPHSVQQYLEFGYCFDTDNTMLNGVRKVPPGHRLEVRGGRIVRHAAFFEPPAPSRGDTRGEAERVDELATLLDQVVAEHLIADVPVGLLLSGGLDSSLVAALAARHGNLTTVCMGFDGSDIDERAHARGVAQHVGSRHVDVSISADDVKAEVMQGAWVFDDLFADWGTMTTRLLYRRCREMGLKVVLVGEGADELFGGYDIFNVPQPLSLWRQFRLYQNYSGRRYGRLFGEFHGIMRDYLGQGDGDAFHAVRLFESRRQMPNQYVMKVDKASMAESVEARAPFLDRRVAELAYRTPRDWLLRNGENKFLLRAVGRKNGLLPAQISGRSKFGAPLAASWMDDDPAFRSFARDLMFRTGSATREIGLHSAMTKYFDQGRSGDAFPRPLSIFRNLAWRLLLLELWSQHYLTPATGGRG